MRAALSGRGQSGWRTAFEYALLCLTLWWGSPVLAQTSQPSAETIATIPYSDPTFGFEMRVPAGWIYDRGRFRGPRGAIGLLRGESKGSAQALQILIFRSFEIASFEQWLRTFETQLNDLHKPNKVVVSKRKAVDRPRAVLIVNPEVEGLRTVTHYLCISFDRNTVWVFVLVGSVAERTGQEALEAQFDQIATSVRVLYNPLKAEQLGVAFKRGMAVLEELRGGAQGVPIDETERYYEIRIAGKAIGYLLRWMRRETRTLDDPRFAGKRKEGLRIHEESWRFADDGTVRYTELNLFSSFDLRSELIEYSTTQIPAPDVQSQRLYIELDQCIREDKVLFSSFSTNLDRDLPAPRPPLPIGPRYLDLAWVRMLPLLLKAAPETYAFAIYDSQARALAVHTIRPLGSSAIPGRAGVSGCAFETREGFVAQPSRLYTDARGNVLRLESGDLVIALTTKEEVERQFAQRREPARRRLEPPQRRSIRP